MTVASLIAITSAIGAAQEVRIIREATAIGPGPLAAAAGRLEPMAPGTGLIFGQAVDAGSTRPVPGALVTLSLSGVAPIRALADGQGRFAFRDLPKGRFNLTAAKAGYVDGAYGRMRPAGPTLPLDLTEGERASGISVSLWKHAAVAGLVVDELGDPIVGAQVRALKRAVVGGQWRLTPGPQDFTDDRGMYRLGMLEPGEYVVAVPMSQNEGSFLIDGPLDATKDFIAFAGGGGGGAGLKFTSGNFGGGNVQIFMEGPGLGASAGLSEDGRPLAYPTQFFPASASSARATIVTVGSGEERTGIDFQLKPVRALRVSGTAMGPEGPAGNLQLTLVPSESDALVTSIETLSSFSDGSGAFTFNGVPPGQYTLRATRTPRIAIAMGGPGEVTTIQQGGAVFTQRIVTNTGAPPPLPTEPTLWAEMSIAVGTSDVADMVVALRPGIRVSGTVQFDGGTARPASDRLPAIFVSLESADARPGNAPSARGRVETSGQFATMGVPPGRYFVRVAGAPQGWTFRGAMLGGRDVSDTALELESSDVSGIVLSFTDRPTELSGRVTPESGSADAATVIVFPTDSSAWVGYGSSPKRVRSARAAKDGAFNFSNLPAGDYYLAAVPDRIAADWQNPKFLEALTADATRIRVSDGEKLTHNVKVAR